MQLSCWMLWKLVALVHSSPTVLGNFQSPSAALGVDVLTGRAEHNSRHCILIRHSATRCKNYQRGMSAGCKHLLVICLLGFLPGKGPLWRIFSLPSINTTSIWIFPYNLFQREYRGCERVKRDRDSCFTQNRVFSPLSISKLKTTIIWGECLIWNSSEDVITAFFFFRALPTRAHNPSTEGCWLLCFSILCQPLF